MSKLIAWIAGFTKVGKAVRVVQDFLDGKKQYLAGIAAVVPSLLTIIQHFQTGGIDYLLSATHSPEYMALVGGIAIIANAAKGEKIRNDNAQIIDNQQKLLDQSAPSLPDSK